MKNTSYTLLRLSTAIVFIFITIFYGFANNASAEDLINRTVRIGDSFPSVVTTHTFDFTTFTASNIGSIQFQYCSNSPLFASPCTAPVGLNVATAGIFSQAGMTGFSVSGASSANNLILTKAPTPVGPAASTYVFSNITNPSTTNQVVYVRISTFNNINATGTVVDRGAVIFVVDDRFDVSAYVPPYMTFCVAVTVALDCSSTSGFLGDFGEFSEFSPVATTTQFAVATNDPTGYNTYLDGQTMTSGTNIIPGLGVQTASIPGTSQFGINLRSNSSPLVGSNVEGLGSGVPTPNYNTSNQFRFVNGERIAGSNITTNFNRYTISYLINISDDQAPGVYATTITYTSVANF